jgi:integral membrane protein (TIGR01906 family)
MVGEPFRKTKMARVAYWLFIICFPLLLLTSTVRLLVNSRHIYEYGFDKYAISEVTGIDEAQLSQVATRLIDYFNSKVETPQIKVVKDGREFELFHDYELIHLKDVKGLFRLDYLVQVIVLAYIVIYALLFLLWKRGRWQDLAKGITRGCILTSGLIAVLGIASIFGFQWLFIQFHRISFSNPYWMLDPSRDYLIMLFPPDFWQGLAIIGGGAIAAEALLLGGIAWAVPFIHQRHLQDKAQ